MSVSVTPVLEFVALSLVPAAFVTAYWALARSLDTPETPEARQTRFFGWFLWVGLVLISAVGIPGTTPGGAISSWKLASALLPIVGLSTGEGVAWIIRRRRPACAGVGGGRA